MNIRKVMVVLAVAAGAAAVDAADYKVKSGITDWTVKDSYTFPDGSPADKVPGASDWVTLPAAEYEIDIDSASFEIISNFFGMEPVLGSKLTIDVPAGRTATLGCAITSRRDKDDTDYDYHRGEIVKTGAGTLSMPCNGRVFTSNGQNYDYFTCLTVEGGDLKFRQNDATGSKYYGILTVAEGATIWASGDANSKAAFCPSEIQGAGVITNAIAKQQTFYLMTPYNQGPSIFSGSIGGSFDPQFSGPVYLTGTNTTQTGGFTAFISGSKFNAMAGITAVQSFGRKGEPSSIGKGSSITIGEHGGGYYYLGKGETTDKDLSVQIGNDADQTSGQPASLDGGAYGGLVFAAGTTWAPRARDAQRYMRLELTGSNAAPCEVYSKINSWDYDGKIPNYTFQMKKSGSGQWNLEATDSNVSGSWTIENGTLGIRMLGESGRPSSLGTSTNLMQFYTGAFDAAKRVPWAISLGGESTSATLAYLGDDRSASGERKVALAGTGVISNGTATGSFQMGGVSALGADKARTLVLDGTSTSADNVISDVSDGEGVVSVEKRGCGTWKLSRDLSFHGSLTVKEGTLVVENTHAQPFSWFKFVVRETWGSSNAQLQELALYDAAGKRQNIGFTYDQPAIIPSSGDARPASYDNVMRLKPGTATYARDGRYWSNAAGDRDLANLFDAQSTAAGWIAYFTGWNAAIPVVTDPSTYIPIAMRLREGTPQIAAFDIAIPGGAATSTQIRDWALEGSTDGVHWQAVTNWRSTAGGPVNTGKVKWYSDDQNTTDTSMDRPGKGFLICGAVTNEFNTLGNVASVSVAPGATLKASGDVTLKTLALDGAGNGTVDGFSFAQDGTLTLSNVPSGGFRATVPNAADLDNVADWTVMAGGKVTRRYSVDVAGDEIIVRPKGLAIILR